MPSMAVIGFIVILVLALTFEFINGFHDTANSVATTISTRAMSPKGAVMLAAVLNFVGTLSSTAVAMTISKGLVAGTVELYIIAGALVAAIFWNLFTWYFGIPSSSSHALIGALIGAAIGDTLTTSRIMWEGVGTKIIFPLFTSPIIGAVTGFLLMTIVFELFRKYSQKAVNKWFSKMQIVSSAFMSFSHGSNDAQKTIGIIVMALVSINATDPGVIPQMLLPTEARAVPLWVVVTCAFVIAAGTSVGGWRIIKTMGTNIIKLNPPGGFAAQTAAAAVILVSSHVGMPVSSTHIMSSSIIGVGAAKRFSAVRWSVARSIVFSWFLTIPICMALGALSVIIIKAIIF